MTPNVGFVRRREEEYALEHGVQVFAISWRNPTAALRDKSPDDHVEACQKAMAVACEVSGSPDCNVLGICAGGITTPLTLGHLAAIGDRRVNAGTLLVTMLDTSLPSMTGMFANSHPRSTSSIGTATQPIFRLSFMKDSCNCFSATRSRKRVRGRSAAPGRDANL